MAVTFERMGERWTGALEPYLTARRRKWLLRGLSVSAFLVLWQHIGEDQFLIAQPTEIVVTLFDQLVVNPVLSTAIAEAMVLGLAGFVLAVGVGVPLGYLIGFWEPAKHVLNPIVDALYVTPLVAMIPLLIIWFGLTPLAKIVFIFSLSFLVVIINTEAGVTETPAGLVDAARVFGATDWRIYTEIHFRHSLPYVMNGVRLASGRAVRAVIIAELFVTAGDLGNYFYNTSSLFQMPKLYSVILSMSVLGVIVIKSVDAVEGRLLSYRTR